MTWLFSVSKYLNIATSSHNLLFSQYSRKLNLYCFFLTQMNFDSLNSLIFLDLSATLSPFHILSPRLSFLIDFLSSRSVPLLSPLFAGERKLHNNEIRPTMSHGPNFIWALRLPISSSASLGSASSPGVFINYSKPLAHSSSP